MKFDNNDSLGTPLFNGDYIAKAVRSGNSGALQFYRITDVSKYKAVLLHEHGKNSNVTLNSFSNSVKLYEDNENLLDREDIDE